MDHDLWEELQSIHDKLDDIMEKLGVEEKYEEEITEDGTDISEDEPEIEEKPKKKKDAFGKPFQKKKKVVEEDEDEEDEDEDEDPDDL